VMEASLVSSKTTGASLRSPKAADKLGQSVETLKELINRLGGTISRLRTVNDRIFGALPPSEEIAKNSPDNSMGSIIELELLFEIAHTLVGQLQDEVSRTEVL